MIKAEFSALFLQSSVSHDLQKSASYAAQEKKKIIIIINVENKCAAPYFSGNCDFFLWFFDEQKVQKNNVFEI